MFAHRVAQFSFTHGPIAPEFLAPKGVCVRARGCGSYGGKAKTFRIHVGSVKKVRTKRREREMEQRGREQQERIPPTEVTYVVQA